MRGPETSVEGHSQPKVTSWGQNWGNEYPEFTLLAPYPAGSFHGLKRIEEPLVLPHRPIGLQEQKEDGQV